MPSQISKETTKINYLVTQFNHYSDVLVESGFSSERLNYDDSLNPDSLHHLLPINRVSAKDSMTSQLKRKVIQMYMLKTKSNEEVCLIQNEMYCVKQHRIKTIENIILRKYSGDSEFDQGGTCLLDFLSTKWPCFKTSIGD